MIQESDLPPIGQKIIERFRELGIPDGVCSHPCVVPFIMGEQIMVVQERTTGIIDVFGIGKKHPRYVELRKVLAKLARRK